MSRNAFAQLDSDDSDNEDVKADVTVETPTVDDGANIDANKDDRTEGQKSKVSLKAQWDRGSSRGQYSPSRSLNKAADIKKEFAAFGKSTSLSTRNRTRYSKEDILALYRDNLEKPADVKDVPKVIVPDCLKPVVLKPMGYEELNGIWDTHMAKRQSRRGGNNQRFQRNTGAQRGANDVRRGAGDARVGGNQNDRWGGNASLRNDNNRGGSNDRGGGRWGRLEASEANKNNSSTSSMDGTAWRRGQKPQVSNHNRNDMNNDDTFGRGMLGVGGPDHNTFEDFAANSAKFEEEMANLRKNAGMGLKMSVDTQGDKFGGALEKESASTNVRNNHLGPSGGRDNSDRFNVQGMMQSLQKPLDAHTLELQMQRQQELARSAAKEDEAKLRFPGQAHGGVLYQWRNCISTY